MDSFPPLLITSCVTPSDHTVGLANPGLRLFHTLEALEHWGNINPFIKIVLCDGSNYNFEPIIKERFPNLDVECLRFQNSKLKVAFQGKGYGEGEIIEYALKNSSTLDKCDTFIKCTGKLWVSNYDCFLKSWNGIFSANVHFKNIFNFKRTKIEYVDTRFYIVNKKFFIENFLDLHFRTSFEKHGSIESLLYEKVTSLHLNRFIPISNPIINGVSGGCGAYYKNNFKRQLKNYLKKMIASKINRFKDLFYS